MREKILRYQLTTIVLAPILVAQGRHVRRVTPRLPEPPGPRSGSEGTGPELRLLILGDSAAAGVGAATQEEALSGQLLSQLRSTFRVFWKLNAQSGYTAKDVANCLEAATAEPFDVALVSVGVNDVTGRTRKLEWCAQQARLIWLLKAKFDVQHILLSSLPPMHLFPALPQPLRWYLGTRAKQFNQLLRKIAGADVQCEFLAISFPLEDGYMAADGFHPGALAYSAWAHLAAATIQARIHQKAGLRGSRAYTGPTRIPTDEATVPP